MTFLTFTIAKFETLKFRICSNDTKIFQSSFKSTKNKNKSQQSTLQCYKSSVVPLKFHEMLLVLWNLINYCKISQFLVKFGKSLKDLRKIFLKWLEKIVNYWLNFVSFRSCTEKWPKVGQLLSITLTKVQGIPWKFSQS